MEQVRQLPGLDARVTDLLADFIKLSFLPSASSRPPPHPRTRTLAGKTRQRPPQHSAADVNKSQAARREDGHGEV